MQCNTKIKNFHRLFNEIHSKKHDLKRTWKINQITDIKEGANQ